MKNPTTRFSSTVEHYAKYRPTYPQELISFLQTECKITVDKIIADIGSGTGIFAKLLLDNGYKVLGIEPNDDMRNKAEILLAQYPKFISVNGTAEATGLADHSVDVITAATALHWFDRIKARQEFNRILKPNGWCLLLWNLRLLHASAFMQGYEDLLIHYGIDYTQVAPEKLNEAEVLEFYQPAAAKIALFPNKQILDWEGFQGRLLSTSYSPKPGHPDFEPMMQADKKLFEQNQRDDLIEFIYNTKLYYGRL